MYDPGISRPHYFEAKFSHKFCDLCESVYGNCVLQRQLFCVDVIGYQPLYVAVCFSEMCHVSLLVLLQWCISLMHWSYRRSVSSSG